jgi:hypothetical protein
MKLKILLTLFSACLLAEQETQVVAHAMTEKERKEVVLNDLFRDLYLISIHSASLNAKQYAAYLFDRYGNEAEFKCIAALFDLMHKECEGKVTISDNTFLGRGLRELKTLVEKNVNDEVSFISLYKNARDFYARFMNCPEFVSIYNIFLLINEREELDENKRKTDEHIKRFKRMLLGAVASGLVEGGLNHFVQ